MAGGWLAKEDYTLDTNVETLVQLLGHLDRPSASIIGSSLGGSTAMAFAAQHPGRVERLVLSDIGPYMPAERRRRRARPSPIITSSSARPICSPLRGSPKTKGR